MRPIQTNDDFTWEPHCIQGETSSYKVQHRRKLNRRKVIYARIPLQVMITAPETIQVAAPVMLIIIKFKQAETSRTFYVVCTGVTFKESSIDLAPCS
jgi:hypothetical protein